MRLKRGASRLAYARCCAGDMLVYGIGVGVRKASGTAQESNDDCPDSMRLAALCWDVVGLAPIRLLTRAVRCWGVKRRAVITRSVLVGLTALAVLPAHAATYYLTISGQGGLPEYDTLFAKYSKELDTALKAGGGDPRTEVLSGPKATRTEVESAFSRLGAQVHEGDFFALMLIGHGTFDGTDYKFNIPGPDVTAAEIAKLMDRVPTKQQAVVVMTSCSGGAISALSRKGRVVITATKSGTERNVVVFTRYWIDALQDPAADTDKSASVSLLEAFKYADRKTVEYYEAQKLLATEHALLVDNGATTGVRNPGPANGQGLAAAAFPLLKSQGETAKAVSPEKQKLVAKKEDLEARIDQLKYQKAAMDETDYKKQMSALLLELAKTQAEIDQ